MNSVKFDWRLYPRLTLGFLLAFCLLSQASFAAAPIAESKAHQSAQCTGENNLYKNLVITSFTRIQEQHQNAGRLFNADTELSKLFADLLGNQKVIINNAQLNRGLPTAALSNDALLAQQVQLVAHKLQTQFVLTGQIIDMSMPDPNRAYAPSLYERFMNGLFDFIEVKNRFDKRDRLFRFSLDLRDGITGESVFSKHYDTYGVWNTTDEIGFASPAFWRTDYGQQIKGITKKAAKDVAQAINCQPYIASIDSRPGQIEVLVQGGANNGLKAGDNLTLYQLVKQGSETDYQLYHTRLVNRNTQVELKEVYPNHSLAVIDTTSYLNGQYLAVAP